MAASIAKIFINLYKSQPEKGRKVLNLYKQKYNNLLKAVKTTNTAIIDINSRFTNLKVYFPGIKCITTAKDSQIIKD